MARKPAAKPTWFVIVDQAYKRRGDPPKQRRSIPHLVEVCTVL